MTDIKSPLVLPSLY